MTVLIIALAIWILVAPVAGIPATLSKSLNVYGFNYALTSTLTANVAPSFSLSIAAAKVGQLTTRTDNSDGTLTMNAGHGFTTGCTLDIYWNGGVRYGMTAGTVATNSVPISGGAGDNLPANLTNITAMIPTIEALVVVGNNAQFIALNSLQGGTVVFQTSVPATIAAMLLTTSQPAYSWTVDDGSTNPLASETVAQISVSHGNSTQAVTMSGVVGYN